MEIAAADADRADLDPHPPGARLRHGALDDIERPAVVPDGGPHGATPSVPVIIRGHGSSRTQRILASPPSAWSMALDAPPCKPPGTGPICFAILRSRSPATLSRTE